MEPIDLANNDPGANALLVQLPAEEISRRTELAINSIPYISGVNNHMGSEFTQHGDEMSIVLKVIAGMNLFFVDSYTSQESVAYKVSLSMGIPTYKRDVFLDNYEDPTNFESNLRILIAIAKSRGQAIAIAHAKIQTAQNFKNLFHILEENNIELVRISQLVDR